MKTLIVFFTAMLWSASAIGGMLHTYRTADGGRLISNHAFSAGEVRARGLVLQEVRFTPDVVPPLAPDPTYFPPMRASVTITDPSPAPSRLSLGSPLYQPVSTTPVTITPVTATPLTITPVTVTPITITPVTITPATPVTPTAITPVTITPVTITPVAVPPPVTAP
jgi:hypothetical protein